MHKKHIPLLKTLKKLSKKELAILVEHLDDSAIDGICECVYNVIYTDLKIPKRKQSEIRKHIKSKCSVHKIKEITDKNIPISKRKKSLSQVGGALPLLLGAAIPFLSNLLFGNS